MFILYITKLKFSLNHSFHIAGGVVSDQSTCVQEMMSQNCGESGLKLIRVHILVYLLALPFCESFLPNFWSRVLTLSWKSNTHQEMTEQAILNITLETLSSINTHKHAHRQNQMKVCLLKHTHTHTLSLDPVFVVHTYNVS